MALPCPITTALRGEYRNASGRSKKHGPLSQRPAGQTHIFILKLASETTLVRKICTLPFKSLGSLRNVLVFEIKAFFLSIKITSRSCLFTVDVETGVLRVLFNEAAS